MKPDNQKRFYLRSMLLGILYGLGLALIFASGFIVRDLIDLSAQNGRSASSEERYELLIEVQTLLDLHYLREQPDYTQRQYNAIRGMLSGLNDRATFFIDPPVTQSESDVLAGTYGGIGVNVQHDSNGLFILYPFDESPAQEAGILDGDRLVSVNGQAIDTTVPQDVIDQLLRGEVKAGNGVEIVVERNEELLTFFVLFDVINIPSVQWRVIGEALNIGYIQILRFTSRTPDEMKTAIDDLNEQGIHSIVLDLRNNYGGLLHESIEVAGFFLDGDIVLYELRKNGERSFNADAGIYTSLPLVVLVNGGTASASELLAGALQDANRAILIGQVTYGKGTIQQIYRLSDNSSIHITSAEWLTPARRQIEAVGLVPDIVTEPDQNRDTEIEEAIQYLQGLLDNGE
jgi:carboxyl-terminal processing protease